MTPTGERARRRLVARVGLAGLVVTLVAHLVWDVALTLVGVSRFGLVEEDSAVVRSLLAVHPALWVGLKLLFVGGFVAVVARLGAHRQPVTVAFVWGVALLGVVGPLGWVELLLA